MADYTRVNLKQDVEDMAAKRDQGPEVEARFARTTLGLEKSGLSLFTLAPGFNLPFGHTHSEQEETYVVVRGNARMKIDDELVDLSEWDAVRVPPNVWRSFGGGPDGAEILAFGAPNTENADAELAPGFWD